MAGVNIKAEGDLSSLDLRSRISLAMLLDIPKDNQDWRYIRTIIAGQFVGTKFFFIRNYKSFHREKCPRIKFALWCPRIKFA